MQRLRQVAGDQNFRIADFVTAENFWRSNRAHLMTMARVIIERDLHNLRLVAHIMRMRAVSPANPTSQTLCKRLKVNLSRGRNLAAN